MGTAVQKAKISEEAHLARWESLVSHEAKRASWRDDPFLSEEDFAQVGRMIVLRSIADHDWSRGDVTARFIKLKIRSGFIDEIRRKKGRNLLAREPLRSCFQELEDLEDSRAFEEGVVVSVSVRKLLEDLRREKPRLALVVDLVFFEEKTFTEAARLMGVSRCRVARLKEKAIEFLRKMAGLDDEID